VQSISVELVLGSDAAAGKAKTPTQSEAPVDAAAVQGEAPDVVKPETARAESEASETARAVEPETTKPVQSAALQPAETTSATPAEQPVKSETAPLASEAPEVTASAPAAASVVQRPTPMPRHAPPRPAPSRKPVRHLRHNDHGKDARTRETHASAASVASSGIGRGRSDADTNYRGIVAAQLARNKSYPPDARRNGDQGRATVSFSIDGNGRVTRVALVRGTGNASLDREAQAMVHRASPFPPPPSGRPMSFTVPVTFDLR
jgi:TonB family protein